MTAQLKTRALGKHLTTTVVGFGGGAVSGEGGGYGFGAISESQATEVLQAAYERGIRLFDTAPIYGFGLSEERMGLALAGNSAVRKNIVLVSKLGVTWDKDRKVTVDNSPECVRRMLEESLTRLKTNYLDVYMIHWPDPKTPVEKTMEALVKAKEEGLIRCIGASNFDTELLGRAQSVGAIDVLQSRFCALDETPKNTLFEACRTQGIGFMSYGTLAKGILAGTVKPGRAYDVSDFRGRGSQVQQQYEAVAKNVERFFGLARDLSMSPSQLAAAWVLSHPEVSVALCGSKSVAQVEEVCQAASVDFSAEVKKELDLLATAATPAFVKAG